MAEQASLDEAAEAALEQDVNPEPLTGEEQPVGAETRAEPGEEDHGDTYEYDSNGALVKHEPGALISPISSIEWTREQVELVKRTVAKGASDDELRLFVAVCQQTQLSPFRQQIYFIKRWDPETKQKVGTFQVAIDGFRLIAERTGEWEGCEGPEWLDEAGAWHDVWLDKTKAPSASRVTAHRQGRRPRVGTALFHEYVQAKDGKPIANWRTMPVHMIGKVAEALALRASFPQELGALYTFDELPTPTNQGPDAVEEAEIVVEVASVETIDLLKAELKMLKGRAGWGENEVLTAARKSFDRKIAKLTDLTQPEAEQIIAAAQQARA